MNLITEIKAWLFITRRCAWHPAEQGKIMHRAPFHRRFTDGICPECRNREHKKMHANRLALVKPIAPKLDEPETPFIIT